MARLEDRWASVRPGDASPDDRHDDVECPFAWYDRHDGDPGDDGPAVPWRCSRDAGHPGQHVAAFLGSHVAAVHPGLSIPEPRTPSPDER